jgi:hypothetical protein
MLGSKFAAQNESNRPANDNGKVTELLLSPKENRTADYADNTHQVNRRNRDEPRNTLNDAKGRRRVGAVHRTVIPVYQR